jgi:hypothetical protein
MPNNPERRFLIPSDLNAWLKELAAENRRSLNSQLVVLVENARRWAAISRLTSSGAQTTGTGS